jgi:hypothetical protein
MENLGLLYISAAAGFFIMIGSLILIAKGRVLVDVTSQSIQEIQLPLGFRLKTQSPFVIMFFFGTFLLAMPLMMVRQQLQVTPSLLVTGKIPFKDAQQGARREHKMRVLATVAYCDNVFDDIRLTVPRLQDLSYRIYYYDDDQGYLYDEPLDWAKVAHNEYPLQGFVLDNHRLFRQSATDIDKAGKVVNPADIVKESAAVESQFKTPEESR